jgi:hypothetical protein
MREQEVEVDSKGLVGKRGVTKGVRGFVATIE